MKITITEPEIEAAIRAYLQETITAEIGDIDFTATRGESGVTAEINVSTGEEAPAKPKRKAPQKKPKVEKAEAPSPEVDAEPADEPVSDDEAEAAALLADNKEAKEPSGSKSLFT